MKIKEELLRGDSFRRNGGNCRLNKPLALSITLSCTLSQPQKLQQNTDLEIRGEAPSGGRIS